MIDYYPIIFDIDWYDTSYKLNDILALYSFWRIDTSKLNFDWFVDPIMESDLDILNTDEEFLKPENFLCTKNIIPNSVLKLFKFKEVVNDNCRYSINDLKYDSYFNNFILVKAINGNN